MEHPSNAAALPENVPCLTGMIERMRQSSRAALALEEEGFDVFAIDIMRGQMPTLQIRHNPKCDALILREEAAYYRRGMNGRCGQFQRHGCRVIWVERFANRSES